MHDSLVSLNVNSHTKLIDENELILDEGTQLSISAIPLSGDPDLFILTETQRLSYLDGNSPEFRVTGADLLQVTSEGSVTWTVDSTHANQPLYLYADNEAGPTGGGDGQTTARFTVIITLLPVLDATITASATTLDVGEVVTLSATSTPNLSSQVDTDAYEWDLDGDGSYEVTGASTEISYSNEGTFSVLLRVNGVDGRTDTTSQSITVADTTFPTAIINGGTIIRGFSESFTVTSSSTDNFGIDREEWIADGALVQSDTGTGNSFTWSFSSAGNHSVSLVAYDLANWSTTLTITVIIQDRTSPVLEQITGPKDVKAGEENSWRLNATDLESPSGLTWSWDFDLNDDADGDGNSKNDNQATGDLVTWSYSKGGDYAITCTVTNEQGLTSTRELNIDVESKPVSKSATMTYVYGGGAILLALAVIAGGIFLFRSMNQRRAHQELMDQEAARIAAEEAEAAREPDHEEQLSMFQNRGDSSSGFARGGGDEMADIAGVGAGYGAQSTPVVSPVRSVEDDALLSAFDEPTVEPTPAPVPEPKPVENSAERSSVISGGIELPSVVSKTTPQTPSKPEPEMQPKEPTNVVEPSAVQTTEVVGTCADCGQQYAVDMPLDVQQAQIDCPKCGNRGTIRR
jgi:DNA-directed RNA polymerase subunit RPC12/RpoP